MRLDRLLANSGIGTRSEVKKMIGRGRVAVGGVIIRDPSADVSEKDSISVDGNDISSGEYIYLIFDKPDEVLTAMEDTRHKCVGDFIPDKLKGKHLSPVGRLDYHTTGLLIITNDGDLNHRITSPRYKIPKTYHVRYGGEPLTEDIIQSLSEGITLTDMDKPVKLAPCVLEISGINECLITLTEGKTHEVRRIISHFGRTVISLRRISIGPVVLEEDNEGLLRTMTPEELQSLKAIL
ncbi:MAG: rRNA pseudouridine synthase [Clostridiales bacterium]|nr:rRNA pseudouridine synthase [Clostridiales bacterium]